MDAKKWKNDDFLIKLILINLKMWYKTKNK
jgi:hypothetical protein